MTAATWAAVHVGDTVRGADGRDWAVTDRVPGLTWLGSGVSDAVFGLRLGDRAVTTRRGLHEPVALVGYTDRGEMFAAAEAFIDAGLNPELLGETVTAATVDQFTTPSQPVKHDRYGRYLLPDPETGKERAWTRVTTVARTLADEYGLTQWKLRQVAKGLALRPDLIAGAAAADPEADKGTLNEIAEQAMERAGSSSGRNLGTALHTFTHRLNRGGPLPPDEVPQALHKDLYAYQEALRSHGLAVRPDCMERVVILPELGVAGRFDCVVSQPAGVTKAAPLSILDLKTAKDVSYSWLEIAIQEAFYTRAPLIWNESTQQYDPMPAVDRDRGLVLHLPVGKAHAQIYGVNLVRGWACAELAMGVRAARSEAKSLAWLVQPEPADLLRHNVSRATREDLARLWELHHPRGEWTEEIHTLATARLAELS